MNPLRFYIIVLTLLFSFPGQAKKLSTATFAGGCFWCMEPPFEKLNGVKSVVSGFIGGTKKNPSYKDVASGTTKHLEAVQIRFDEKLVSYNDLLTVYWRNINPTDSSGQFVDRGSQYRPAIFFHTKEQQQMALASKQALEKTKRFKEKITVEILEAGAFYRAEEYHQDFYKKSSLKYKYYRYRSGRDQFLDKHWSKEERKNPLSPKNKSKDKDFKKPSKTKLKSILTPLQYKVTQEDGTEPAFKNKYWDNKTEGIYVDIVSKEVLFSSTHKYKSGTGWPSFYQPVDKDSIVEKEDHGLFSVRTEVRSKLGDSHLGHVFNDGPQPTGLRYCINSAALEFIPKEKMKERGYDKYLPLFGPTAENP